MPSNITRSEGATLDHLLVNTPMFCLQGLKHEICNPLSELVKMHLGKLQNADHQRGMRLLSLAFLITRPLDLPIKIGYLFLTTIFMWPLTHNQEAQNRALDNEGELRVDYGAHRMVYPSETFIPAIVNTASNICLLSAASLSRVAILPFIEAGLGLWNPEKLIAFYANVDGNQTGSLANRVGSALFGGSEAAFKVVGSLEGTKET